MLQEFLCGATIFFSTIFKNNLGVVVQPGSASVNVEFYANGIERLETIVLTPPTSPATNWTGQWDSRGADPGVVTMVAYNTDAFLPYSRERQRFNLLANIGPNAA